jgi:hypothetical protein
LKKLIPPILLCGALAAFSMPAAASLQLNPVANAQPPVKKFFDVSCDASYGGDELTYRHGMWGKPKFKGNARGNILQWANGQREVHVTSYNIVKNPWVDGAGNKANLNLLWNGTKSKSQGDNLKQYLWGNDTQNHIEVSISAGNTKDLILPKVQFIFDKPGKDVRCEATIT